MKIKVTRPDGTVVEAEGTAEECARVVGVPVYIPSLWTWTGPGAVYPNVGDPQVTYAIGRAHSCSEGTAGPGSFTLTHANGAQS